MSDNFLLNFGCHAKKIEIKINYQERKCIKVKKSVSWGQSEIMIYQKKRAKVNV